MAVAAAEGNLLYFDVNGWILCLLKQNYPSANVEVEITGLSKRVSLGSKTFSPFNQFNNLCTQICRSPVAGSS